MGPILFFCLSFFSRRPACPFFSFFAAVLFEIIFIPWGRTVSLVISYLKVTPLGIEQSGMREDRCKDSAAGLAHVMRVLKGRRPLHGDNAKRIVLDMLTSDTHK